MLKKIFLALAVLALGAGISQATTINGQLIKAGFERLASSPTGYEGRVYQNTVSHKAQYYNGTAWVDFDAGTAWTAGSVLFGNGTGVAQDNANIFWDDTNNRLGIGTTAPTTDFQIQPPAGSGAVTQTMRGYGGGGSPILLMQRAQGTVSATTQTLSGQNLGNIFMGGYTSSNAYTTTGVEITGVAGEDQTSSAQGAYLTFLTTPVTTTTATERLRISTQGEMVVNANTDGVPRHSGATTNERVERAYIAYTTGTPAASSQTSTWISSISDNGTGDATINFTASKFSAAPSCVVTPMSASAVACVNSVVTTTSAARIICSSTTTGVAADINFYIICMGPH